MAPFSAVDFSLGDVFRNVADSYPGSITLSGANSEEHLTSNLIAKKFKLTMNELESFKEFALDSKIYWDERKQLKWN